MSSAPVCPPGFDCAFANSCPKLILDCPAGFLCSSYAGAPHQNDIDFQYAKELNMFNHAVVTRDTKEDFVPFDRSIQTRCMPGFYCPNATTILPCPTGHWCAEMTVEPHTCNALSFCNGEQKRFEINIMNTVLMLIIVGLSTLLSMLLVRRQKQNDAKTHENPPSGGSTASETNHRPQPVVSADQDDVKNEIFANGLMEVTFNDILFSHTKAADRVILPNISGKIPGGSITGILGPTACGKSTLLNILSKGGYDTHDVQIYVHNISKQMLWTFQPTQLTGFIGHVPQEDILDRDLTVRELLTFHAKARILHPCTDTEIDTIVTGVLNDLSIAHIADSVIGGGENLAANISGGQLKRVNIGCELVAMTSPGILFLDEPTAGLDASIAYELVETLDAVRLRGITIVMILQQPRAEIFAKIDHLLLMNTAGGIVYEGTSHGAVPYLHSLGYVPNEVSSDADYCLDILNGLYDTKKLRSIGPEKTSASAVPVLVCSLLHEYWIKHVNESLVLANAEEATTTAIITSNPSTNQSSALPVISDTRTIHGETVTVISYEGATITYTQHSIRIIRLLWMNAQRLFVIRTRNTKMLWVYICINMIMAVALATGFSILLQSSYLKTLLPPVYTELKGFYPSPLHKYRHDNVFSLGFAQLLFFMSSAIGCGACLTTVPVFSGQETLIKRELSSGMYLSSYIIGRICADMFFVILNAFCFAGIWGLFSISGSFYDWIVVIICTSFAASGIGYIAGAIDYNNGSAIGIVITFVACVFAGTEPTLTQVTHLPVVNWPWYLSYATYTAEATYYTWTRYLMHNGGSHLPMQRGADHYGYVIDAGLGRSVGALIALGIAMRIIAGLIVWRKTSS